MEVQSITHLTRELIPQGQRRTHHNLAQLMFIQFGQLEGTRALRQSPSSSKRYRPASNPWRHLQALVIRFPPPPPAHQRSQGTGIRMPRDTRPAQPQRQSRGRLSSEELLRRTAHSPPVYYHTPSGCPQQARLLTASQREQPEGRSDHQGGKNRCSRPTETVGKLTKVVVRGQGALSIRPCVGGY